MDMDNANNLNQQDHHHRVPEHLRYGDASGMILTDEERSWASEIKAALRERSADLEIEVDRISDMNIAQIAIVKYRLQPNNNNNNDENDDDENDDDKRMAEVVDIAYKLQCFRDQYRILDTVEDGVASVAAFMDQQEGFLLDVSYLPSLGAFNWSCDYACVNPGALKMPADWRTFQAGCYYQMLAASMDFRSIRKGLMTLSECDGMDFHNFDMRVFEQLCNEFWDFFPLNYKETVWLNTPLVANICYSVVKKVISKEMADSWRVGEKLQEYDGRLDALFNVPNREQARRNLLERMGTYLASRYQNERIFSLPDVIPED